MPFMSLTSFANRSDMVIEINKLGDLYDIKNEFIQSPYTYMLCCANMNENKCEARIIGMYSQKTKTYEIKRTETIHSCAKNKKRVDVLGFELRKPIYSSMRIGEIVEHLHMRLKAGYLEIFRCFYKVMNTEMVSFGSENLCNNNLCQNLGNNFIGADYCYKEAAIENMIGSADFIKSTGFDPVLADAVQEDLIRECLSQLKTEFEGLNPSVACSTTKNSFFFKHTQMNSHLRDIPQLKVYTSGNRTVVLGILFDYNDEHIINSCLISDDQKAKAIEQFLELNPGVSFYLVEMDLELIRILKSKEIGYFINSRAVSFFLQESKENDPNALEYFNELNYGEKEFLDTEKQVYLKAHCPRRLFNLNNASLPDFDFITPSVISLPLVDCITSLIWLISADIKNRKSIPMDTLESKLPEYLLDIFEEFDDAVPTACYEPDLSSGMCGCGRFQENLFPCIHAYKKIKQMGHDPVLYVSSIYSNENMLKIDDIIPVVDVRINPQRGKAVSKRKKIETASFEDTQSCK